MAGIIKATMARLVLITGKAVLGRLLLLRLSGIVIGKFDFPLVGWPGFCYSLSYEKERRPGFYFGRVAGGHRYHRHLGFSSFACFGQSKSGGEAN